ncbi:MAG: hypothetical protein DRP97_02255 [Candidatus Latescibacterota bacterium]|nr:MAG: hypothetical protein DRP97_02255 [Candidatus Latescibacterota bacterium]
MYGNDLNFMADTAKDKGGAAPVDTVAALMDVQVAEEGLLIACTNFDMLTTACENIEAGVVLADAIAAKGDENTAVAVAIESLRQNLKVLGQEHIAGMVVTAGTESITSANEGISDMLGKAWAKTKEIAMKIWNWIVDLVSKVGNFLASLIGKGNSTYERMVKLVKKHKDAKTTNLDGAEFSESVQKSLNTKFKILATEKDISSSTISESITEMTSLLEVLDSAKSDILKAELPFNNIENMMKYAEAYTTANGGDKKNADAIATVVKSIISNTTTFSKDFKLDAVAQKKFGSNKVLDILDAAEAAVGDVEGGVVSVLGASFSGIRCIAVCTTSDATDAMDEFDKLSGDDKKVSKIFSLAGKILNNVKVVEFTVSPEESDYEDNAKDIMPLEFSEIESLKDDMKDADKKSAKIVKSFGDKIAKEKKEVEKLLKTTMKNIDKSAAPISDKIKSILSKVVNNNTKIAKAKASAVTAMAKDLVASPVYDYCAESAKLYKKD